MSDVAIIGAALLSAPKPDPPARTCPSCLGECVWSKEADRSARCIAPATQYDFLCDRHREYKNRVLRIGRRLGQIRTLYEWYRQTEQRNPAKKTARSREAIRCATGLGRNFVRGPAEPKAVARYVVATAIAAESNLERPLRAETVVQTGSRLGLELSVYTFASWPAILDAVNFAESPPWATPQKYADS